MKKGVIFIGLWLFLWACSLEKTPCPNTTGLGHTVFFSLKKDISEKDKQNFKKTLTRLSKIKCVKSVIVAERSDVGDEERALRQFDVMMQVIVEDTAALRLYDNDAIHQEVRKLSLPYLSGAPASFDYFIEK